MQSLPMPTHLLVKKWGMMLHLSSAPLTLTHIQWEYLEPRVDECSFGVQSTVPG